MSKWLQIGPNDTRAYLATPASGSGPGILVLHAWWGLTQDFTNACDRLAEAGFVAFAPSLYPHGATTDSIAEAEQLVSALEGAPDKVEALILSATDHLRQLPAATGERIGAIGFSLGAWWALHLSQIRPDDVGAAVTVYGANNDDYSRAKAAYLGHFAEHDDYEPQEYVHATEDAIRSAGLEVAIHTYPATGHWFVEPSRPDVYDVEATALVWKRTLAFFKKHLA